MSSEQRCITLNFGGKYYYTTKTTVQRNEFFRQMLEMDAFATEWFVDGDPDLFEHIFRYLRRGTLPFFYGPRTGHDYAKYHALEHEATHFALGELAVWLRGQKYRKALQIQHTIEEMEDDGNFNKTQDSDVQVELQSRWTTKKIFVCPRDIDEHRGSPRRCGKACRKEQGDDENTYEDENTMSVAIKTKASIFDARVLKSDEMTHNIACPIADIIRESVLPLGKALVGDVRPSGLWAPRK